MSATPDTVRREAQPDADNTPLPQTPRGPTPATSGQTPMILVEGLEKRYPKRPTNAVDGVSFEVAPGEVFGLLGPNGAGKTTTIGVLTTRVRPTGGRAAVGGVDVVRDPVAAKRRFAVVPQRNNLDRSLTARQNLLFHAAYFGFSRHERERRADLLLDQFGLGDRGTDRVDRYSGGMAQRLMIARALMHAPDLIFLDEPSTGLDPQARFFVWDRVRDLNAQGLTVLLTTHDMDEAEELCGRVAIMDRGKILALDTPDALKRSVPGASALEVQLSFPSSADVATMLATVLAELRALPAVERVEQVTRAPAGPPAGVPGMPGMGGPSAWAGAGSAPPGAAAKPAPSTTPVIRLYAAEAAALIAPATDALKRHGATIRDLRVTQASLEDVFIGLTGRGLR